MSGRVIRVTSFKVPNKEHQKQLVELYHGVKANAKKDGKPYVLRLNVGIVEEGPRSDGYTVVNHTEFASMEDMDYWEKDDESHELVRQSFRSQGIGIENITTIYFHPLIVGGTENA